MCKNIKSLFIYHVPIKKAPSFEGAYSINNKKFTCSTLLPGKEYRNRSINQLLNQ